MQSVVERLIDRQFDLVGGGHGVHVRSLGAKRGGGYQVIGAAKVSDQLRQSEAAGRALIDDRVVEIAGSDARVFFRLNRRQAAIDIRIVGRLLFPRDLPGCKIQQPVHRNLRIVLQRQRLGILHSQPHLGTCCWATALDLARRRRLIWR